MCPPQLDEGRGELDQLVVDCRPVDPGELIVLAVGVVVAVLGAAELVAVQHHRHALGQEQGGEEVPPLPRAQRQDVVIVGRTFGTAVPRPVVALPVVVVLAVGLVVLLVVADQVREGEPVVGRHEVDTRGRPAAGVLVQIRGAGEPGAELTDRAGLAPPEIPDGVTVLAVPFGPERWKVADLVAAVADVPWLGDQLDLAHDGVLVDEVEERGQLVDVVQLAGQRGGEVEPESVDVHLGHPVPQRVHDQLQRVRVADVQRVPGARVVHVVLRVVVHQPVVRAVVDPAEAQRRTEMVALRRVVVDDVEDDLDTRLVQRPDHPLELRHLLTALAGPAVGVVRREESDRVVAPVVGQSLLLEGVILNELVHGHQLDRGHPEPAEVLDRRGVRDRAVRAAQLLGNVRMQLGEALDVCFVDDRLVVRRTRMTVAVPVEEWIDDHRAHHVRSRVVVVETAVLEAVVEQRLVPVDGALDRLGVGVEQQFGRVAPRAILRFVRPVDPEPVPLAGVHAGQVGMPDEAVHLRQVHPGFLAGGVEQAHFHPLADLGEQGEVRAGSVEGGTQGVRRTGPDLHRRPFAS